MNTVHSVDPARPDRPVHLVLGAGAVGSGVATRLADTGATVRLVTRSGSGPRHDSIERISADVTDTDRLRSLAAGAESIFNCVNPPYSKWATAWPPMAASILTAAESSGARLVTIGNLYGYAAGASPMRATDELAAPTRKGSIRVAMWREAAAAHEAGRVRATEIRASDFFGPGIGESGHLGDRTIPRALAGKAVSVVGSPDQPHSWTYIEDVCRTLVTVGLDDRALGRAWHVPTVEARTARQMIEAVCRTAGVEPVKVKGIPTGLIKAIGLVNATMREIPEMVYQFDRPFVIDADETTEVFGLEPTPFEEQLTATVAAYRQPVAA